MASAMLEDIKGGLTQESARLVCRRILPETRAMTVAITDEDNVLACAGEFEEKLLPDTPIHTLATRYVIEHGIVQSFNRMVDVVGSDGSHNQVPAGIIAPIKVGDRTVGTLKFYYKTPRRRRPYPVRACLGLCRDLVHAARHPRARGAKGTHGARRGACAASAD